MILWRISNYADLSGRGGLFAAGRWHHQGVPVVYCCDHPSTALLEVLVHVNKRQLPRKFQLLKIECPDDIDVVSIDINAADLARMEHTQARGSALLQGLDVCLVRVPSAIIPEAFNILINPSHPRAADIKIVNAKTYPFDSRLFG
jgi:RES domain-containing protein